MIVDGNIDAINPDELSNRVMHWHKNKKMDNLMNFLARYVRSVHADCYFRKVLLNHPGGTYLDVITPSDIAYVISVIKKSAHLARRDGPRSCNTEATVHSGTEEEENIWYDYME